MRAIELLILVVFLAGGAAATRAAWRAARARGVAEERWAPYHRFDGTVRRVYVRLGDELEPVGEVGSSDPDYDERFLRLMDQARERAATLNSER